MLFYRVIWLYSVLLTCLSSPVIHACAHFTVQRSKNIPSVNSGRFSVMFYSTSLCNVWRYICYQLYCMYFSRTPTQGFFPTTATNSMIPFNHLLKCHLRVLMHCIYEGSSSKQPVGVAIAVVLVLFSSLRSNTKLCNIKVNDRCNTWAKMALLNPTAVRSQPLQSLLLTICHALCMYVPFSDYFTERIKSRYSLFYI